MSKEKGFGIDGLLSQNGDRYFVDDMGELEVIIKVTRTRMSPQRPHGLNYSLVLLHASGQRLVCFDNAHSVRWGTGPGKKNSHQFDHKHVGSRILPYEFVDASKLMEDFWQEVDRHLLGNKETT